jgi:deoxyribodipyrimidine photolyase
VGSLNRLRCPTYFRIFNPVTQSEKFDPEGKFIRRYMPELSLVNNKDIHAPWLAKNLPMGFQLDATTHNHWLIMPRSDKRHWHCLARTDAG